MAIDGQAAGEAGAPRRLRSGAAVPWIVTGAVLLTAATRLFLIFATRATEEDLYITLRYAQNLAHGLGFVYNAGEYVLGTTTPLYTLLLALAIRVHLDPILTGKLLSVAADAGSCLFAWRLGSALKRPVAGLCAGLCLAVAPLNLTESVKGMESSLVACACVGAWALWAEGRNTGAWICAALVTLLRIDGALLAALLLAACIIRDRTVPRRGLLAFALLTLPWIVYATAVFGSPVPTSLRAKLVVYGWHNTALFPNLPPFLRLMIHNPLGLFLAVGAVAATIFAFWDWRAGGKLPGEASSRTSGTASTASTLSTQRNAPGEASSGAHSGEAGRSPQPGSLLNVAGPADGTASGSRTRPGLILPPMIAWLMVYYGGMAFSKVFLFGWYFLPPTPVYYLAAFAGWDRIVELARLALRPRGVDRVQAAAGAGVSAPIAAGCLLAAALLACVTVPRVARTLRDSQRVEETLRIPIGLWLKVHATPAETVMLEPIGYIGYFSGLRVLDTVGLVSPEVLPLYRQEEASPYHAMWTRFRPEWVLLRAGEWQDLQRYERALPAGERIEAHYRPAQSWRSPGSPPDSAPAFLLFRRTGP